MLHVGRVDADPLLQIGRLPTPTRHNTFREGVIITYIIHHADIEPAVFAGLLILFVAFETGFYGLTALLSQAELLGKHAWYQIAIANLLAALSMGTHLWRAHPTLRSEFSHARGGTE